MKHWAIVPAAGSGQRMGAPIPKQYLSLAGRPVLEHALAPLCGHPRIDGVLVVVAPGDDRFPAVRERVEARCGLSLMTAPGGGERFESVLNGLAGLAGSAAADDWVLVHDAARPCLTRRELDTLITSLAGHPVGGLLALPVGDTLKRAGADGETVRETVDREGLWRALTPQMFRLGALTRALERCRAQGVPVTDECQAIERFEPAAARNGPRLVAGEATNIKITHPGDLELAARCLAARP